MIPYETVRHHLERTHWITTHNTPWNELVTIHEHEHQNGDPHRTQLPLIVPTLTDLTSENPR